MRITLKVLAVTLGRPGGWHAECGNGEVLTAAAGYKYYNHACIRCHSSAAPAQSPGYGGPVSGAVSGMQSGAQSGAAAAGPWVRSSAEAVGTARRRP